MVKFLAKKISFLIVFLLIKLTNLLSITIVPGYISLTYGDSYQLTVNTNEYVVWSSNNDLIRVSENGLVTALINEHKYLTKAKIMAYCPRTEEKSYCDVSVVEWITNKSFLKSITNVSYYVLGSNDTATFFIKRDILFYTLSDTTNSIKLANFSDLNKSYYKMIFTPYGCFLLSGKNLYYSKDFRTWHCEISLKANGIYQSLTYNLDSISNIVNIFASEYSVDSTFRCSIYRAKYNDSGLIENWKCIHTFYSLSETKFNFWPACRHIHIITVDPYTGHLWVGTGDEDNNSYILYSDNFGETFKIVGFGSQDYRTLSIWFTKKYIYWNMDSNNPQYIWRLPRSVYNENNRWPSLTPELTEGETKIGVKYYVRKNASEIFPVKEGQFYIENKKRTLNAQNYVIACNDTNYVYKEKAASLVNSALWNTVVLPSKYNANKGDILLMSSNAEGHIKDDKCRVFGLKENTDGNLICQELFSFPSTTKFTQLMPMSYGLDGNVFFNSYYLDGKTVIPKTCIVEWNDLVKKLDIDSLANYYSLNTINNNSFEGKLMICSPNPVKDYLKIDLFNLNFKESSLSVINLYGRVMLQYFINDNCNEYYLNLISLKKGIYIVKLNCNNYSDSSKIIKE